MRRKGKEKLETILFEKPKTELQICKWEFLIEHVKIRKLSNEEEKTEKTMKESWRKIKSRRNYSELLGNLTKKMDLEREHF